MERKNNLTDLSWGFQAGAADSQLEGSREVARGAVRVGEPHRRGQEVKTGRVESKTTLKGKRTGSVSTAMNTQLESWGHRGRKGSRV